MSRLRAAERRSAQPQIAVGHVGGAPAEQRQERQAVKGALPEKGRQGGLDGAVSGVERHQIDAVAGELRQSGGDIRSIQHLPVDNVTPGRQESRG